MLTYEPNHKVENSIILYICVSQVTKFLTKMDNTDTHGNQGTSETLLRCNGECPQPKKEPKTAQREELKKPEEPDVDTPLLPAPLDGGWGWVILAASFFCAAVIEGNITLMGVILPHLLEHFDGSRAKTTFAGSLMIGGFLMSGKCHRSEILNKNEVKHQKRKCVLFILFVLEAAK